MSDQYLIWSWEHGAWWRSARRGYTTSIREAGRYTFDEAADITVGHIPPGEEVAVLFTPHLLTQQPEYRPPAYGRRN